MDVVCLSLPRISIVFGFGMMFAGLVTFADGGHGLPRQEGKFDSGKLIESCDCSSQVKKAQEAAATARNAA